MEVVINLHRARRDIIGDFKTGEVYSAGGSPERLYLVIEHGTSQYNLVNLENAQILFQQFMGYDEMNSILNHYRSGYELVNNCVATVTGDIIKTK